MNVLELFAKITTFVFDVDGVLTDGKVLLLENGLQARSMNIKDGLALQMAQSAGYRVIIISGGSSEPVASRLQYLGMKEIHLGVKDKLKLLKELQQAHHFELNQTLYMGDDLPDIPVLQQVGLAACPADAVAEVKQACHYISGHSGGGGAVRDVIEKVLKLHGKWTYTTEVSSR